MNETCLRLLFVDILKAFRVHLQLISFLGYDRVQVSLIRLNLLIHQ